MPEPDDDVAEEDLCGCGDMLVEGEELCLACRDIEEMFGGQPLQHSDGSQ